MSLKLAALAAAVVVSVPAAAHEPRVIRTFTVPGSSNVQSDAAGSPLPRGSHVVLWSIACEPSTSSTTFDNPTTSTCFPAKLHLPDAALGPTGGPANAYLKRLSTCLKTDLKKAPDDVVAAVIRGEDTSEMVAKQSEKTVLVVARVSYEEGRSFEVTVDTGGAALPLPTGDSGVTLSLVDGPSARAIGRALARHKFKTALSLAKRAFAGARAGDEKVRAAGNLALAAAMAGDASAVPAEPQIPEGLSEAGYSADDNIASLQPWLSGEAIIGEKNCL